MNGGSEAGVSAVRSENLVAENEAPLDLKETPSHEVSS